MPKGNSLTRNKMIKEKSWKTRKKTRTTEGVKIFHSHEFSKLYLMVEAKCITLSNVSMYVEGILKTIIL